MKEEIIQKYFKEFASQQLNGVMVPFWQKNIIDDRNGGFLGEIDMDHNKKYDADKGIILNARILWTFSALYNRFGDKEYLTIARRAREYLKNYFLDKEMGGYYWIMDAEGKPKNTKKQVYAQAFMVYALAEYAAAVSDPEAARDSENLVQLIEEKSFDREKNGYLEAFSRDWGEAEDLRLSLLDMNEKKTMNTHLHIIEAYTRLFKLKISKYLGERIDNLLNVFYDFILDEDKTHLDLFFDETWKLKSTTISYGHEIEAAWLLREAALTIAEKNQVDRFTEVCVNLADSAMSAIGPEGGLIHEGDRIKKIEKEYEWWAQAEAIIGFIDAGKITGNEKYFQAAAGVAKFIEKYFVDNKYGEWYYRLDDKGKPMEGYEKAGFWKCPYHGIRMCLEILER